VPPALATFHAGLERLLDDRPGAVVIASAEGAADATYAALVDSLDRPT
jgi:hypothetical protein